MCVEMCCLLEYWFSIVDNSPVVFKGRDKCDSVMGFHVVWKFLFPNMSLGNNARRQLTKLQTLTYLIPISQHGMGLSVGLGLAD